ncbi:MAG: amidase domain-containing protein, partial [Oscillospiraceae bacterium]
MPNQLIDVPYYRERAVAYANYWAYRRNPKFYSFDEIGGDCTNFISQALYAANDVMNFTPTYGWYYRDLNDRAPAWTSVVYLFQFLTTNKGAGPYGHEIPLGKIQR